MNPNLEQEYDTLSGGTGLKATHTGLGGERVHALGYVRWLEEEVLRLRGAVPDSHFTVRALSLLMTPDGDEVRWVLHGEVPKFTLAAASLSFMAGVQMVQYVPLWKDEGHKYVPPPTVVGGK
jgi:hypothetical protein